MANLPDGSGDAYSNLVQGDGSASLTFVMPGTVPLAVGSVVATVDNSAGAATTATLVIRDSSGEVIATKRQSATIDAGASGTATWALRLDDDASAGGSAFVIKRGIYNAPPTDVLCATTTNMAFAYESGDDLLDTTTPDVPLFRAAGSYLLSGLIYRTDNTGHAGGIAMLRVYSFSIGSDGFWAGNTFPLDTVYTSQSGSALLPYNAFANNSAQVAVDHNVGVPSVTTVSFAAVLIVEQIA